MRDTTSMTSADRFDFAATTDDATEAEFVIITIQQKTREAEETDSHDRMANLETAHLLDDGWQDGEDPYSSFDFTVELPE